VKVGITGHQNLGPTTRSLLQQLLLMRLGGVPALEGLSSLAAGADQIFAEIVLSLGGRLVAVVPAADYAEGFSTEDRDVYEQLLARAAEVVQLPYDRAGEQAYWEAGQRVVTGSELLLALWDGQPSAGLGGTADVVDFARRRGTLVEVLWPSGARRG
jgi:hypothetical protein